MQRLGHRLGAQLTKRASFVGLQINCLSLDVVKRGEELQGLLGNLALVAGMQVEELSSRVSRTSDFDDALLESGLVPAVVIAHKLALPVTQEGAGMLAGAAVGEVIDYGSHVCELRCGIRPQVGTMRFSLTGTEHLHRRLIGMQHALLQYLLMQRVDQRLQPHSAHAYPGSKCRPRDRQTGARKDTLLPVQW